MTLNEGGDWYAARYPELKFQLGHPIRTPSIGVTSRFHSRPERATKPPSCYLSTVTLVILSAFPTCPILASPTTEPGRRGWKRRLGSPISAPHFFARPSRNQPLNPHLVLPCAPLCALWFKPLPLDRNHPTWMILPDRHNSRVQASYQPRTENSPRLTLITPSYPSFRTPHRIQS